ncbi:MAG: WD40/YVTN/BNR-like repeat-containing protein [Pseudomonadota bacterium]
MDKFHQAKPLCIVLALLWSAASVWGGAAVAAEETLAAEVGPAGAAVIYADGFEPPITPGALACPSPEPPPPANDAFEFWLPPESGMDDREVVNRLFVSSDAVFAATLAGVKLSCNGGRNWTSRSTGLPESSLPQYFAASGSTLFVALGYGPPGVPAGVYRSNNGGASWVSMNEGLPVPVDPNGLYPTVRGMVKTSTSLLAYVQVDSVLSMYRRADNSAVWTLVGQGLPPEFKNADGGPMFVDGTRVYLGTLGRMFLSDDDGVTWTPLPSTGLDQQLPPIPYVFDGVLFGRQFLSGLYRYDAANSQWNALTPFPVPGQQLAWFGTTYYGGRLFQTVERESFLGGARVFSASPPFTSWVEHSGFLPSAAAPYGGLDLAVLPPYMLMAGNRGGVWRRALNALSQ